MIRQNLVELKQKYVSDPIFGDRIYAPPRTIIPINPAASIVEQSRYVYPEAVQSRGMKVAGKYALGFPEGAVIHFTADRNSPETFIAYMRRMGYCTFLIDRDGKVYQDFSLENWGHHAGKSSWAGVDGTVSDEFVGIEITATGRCEKTKKGYLTWYKKYLPESDVRYSARIQNIQEGYYDIYTEAQLVALEKLLIWLWIKGNGIFQTKNIVGHDEVSPGRKNDPGASLPWTMRQYREIIRSKIIQLPEYKAKYG